MTKTTDKPELKELNRINVRSDSAAEAERCERLGREFDELTKTRRRCNQSANVSNRGNRAGKHQSNDKQETDITHFINKLTLSIMDNVRKGAKQ